MPWVRLDDRFSTHRKVALLSDRAFRLYVSALCWASENLTEGRILDRELTLVARVRDVKRTASELESAQLWDRFDGGWMIHDFLEYNPDRARVKAEREANAARQKAYRDRKKIEADANRNAEEIKRNGVTDPSRNASRNGGSNGTPSRPVPSPASPTEKQQAGRAAPSDVAIPLEARPLVDELSRNSVIVCWPFGGRSVVSHPRHDPQKRCPRNGRPRHQGRRRQPVESAKYFLAGWRELPPLPEPSTDRPSLRASPETAGAPTATRPTPPSTRTDSDHERPPARQPQRLDPSPRRHRPARPPHPARAHR
jgi:hypothetical protein